MSRRSALSLAPLESLQGRRSVARYKHKYTPEQVEAIRSRYPIEDTHKLADSLGLHFKQLNLKASAMGIKKTREYRSATNARVAKEAPQAYQKGQSQAPMFPVGEIKKMRKGYAIIKVAQPSSWMFLHHKIWIDANGPIPEGMYITFKDGNKENCTLENLDTISQKELLAKNSVHNLPPALKEIVMLRANILRCITVRERKKKNGK